MFTIPTTQPKLTLLEEETLRYWKTHHIFEKAAELRRGGLPYRAIPQPPAPVHQPDFQPTVEFVFQDLILRYKTMRGYNISWQVAWNTHGLMVELGAEARLGLSGARQIAAYGLGRFHELCRRSAFDYLLDWQRLVERLGLWADWDQVPTNITNDRIEATWQVFKTLSERGSLVQETRVFPYCPYCATSQGSPTGQLPETFAEQYSLYFRLPLVEDPGTSLLVWTNQPWSLPGNIAVGANPEAEYVIVEHDLPEQSGGGSEKLILAAQRATQIFKDDPVRTFETFRGSRLKGLRYQPLFTYLLPDKPAYQVVLSETVGLTPGTGLQQISPRFDEKARQIAQTNNLPVLPAVASDGAFVSEIRPWRGISLRQAAPLIAQDLQQRGLALSIETTEKYLPACPDCGSALIDYVSPAWVVSSVTDRHRLTSLARSIDWRPLLPQAEAGPVGLTPIGDWLVSRGRSWGAPLPVWECRRCHHQQLVSSLAELAELAKEDLPHLDLHRPALDAVELTCPECEEKMRRLPDVLDSWFEQGVLGCFASSSVDNDMVELLCSVFGQPQDWLTAMHSISSLTYDRAACHRVLILPRVYFPRDEGQEHASSLQNEHPTPLTLLREQGADALRWTLFLQPPSTPLQITPGAVSQAGGGLLGALWGLGELLTSRVDLHQLRLHQHEDLPVASPQVARLDAWLRSRLHSLIRDVTTALEAAEIQAAALALQKFVLSDLTGWYAPLRLEARRDEIFRSEDYLTFFETLATLSCLIAPALPFLAEHLYQSLARGPGLDGRASVHLTDWPTFDETAIQTDLEMEMDAVRRLVDLGMQARQQASIPLHQPLAEAAFTLDYPEAAQVIESHRSLLCHTLNVRQARLLDPAEEAEALADERHTWAITSAAGDTTALALRLTPELISEGLAGEFIIRVLELRQKADLPALEPVRIVYMATARLAEALETHQTRILAETQAVEMAPFTQTSSPRLSEATKRLFTIVEFHNEKLTFGIERV